MGLPRAWTFWVLDEAPEEVVIGMDLMWEWHVNSDPRDSRLYQLPPLPTEEGRSLYSATPERGRLEEPGWDPSDLVMCTDGHQATGMRLATAGFTLHSVTASGEEEAEALLAFRAALPEDLLEVVSQHELLFQPPDAQPPEREVTHQIVLAPDAIPQPADTLPALRLEVGSDAGTGRGVDREGMGPTFGLPLGFAHSFCTEGWRDEAPPLH